MVYITERNSDVIKGVFFFKMLNYKVSLQITPSIRFKQT